MLGEDAEPLEATGEVKYADDSEEDKASSCIDCGGDIQTDFRGNELEVYCGDCGKEY